MNTFHKIALALAGSLNNGTSSPAPQGGNRALSNETNALASAFAERQAQPSAKTPPILNPIGKGIGKFWIPILLATATALSTIPIEKAGAWVRIDKNGNESSGPSPSRIPDPVDILLTWGSTNSATYTPAAVPPHPTWPLIKETALAAGTWLVAVIAEWAIHEQMDKAAKNAEGQEATCEIEWVFWEENSTELTTTVYPGSFYPSWFPRGSTKTTSARQGMQNTPASGTWGWDGKAMTGAEADSHLHHIRGTIITASYEVINSRRHRHSAIAFTCREDTFNTAKRRVLQAYRRRTGDSTWDYRKLLDKYTRKYNVRSYGINSNFDDPFPKLKKLAEPGIDEEARSYEVKATWKIRRLLGNGKFGAEIDMEKSSTKAKQTIEANSAFPITKTVTRRGTPAGAIKRFQISKSAVPSLEK